jgi:hypothetical protein
MADWSDPELLKALAISIIGLGVGLWWIRSKLKEVEERQSRRWGDSADTHSDE